MIAYRVTYEIDVEAESPIMAAEQAHFYMTDEHSLRPILSVVDPDGNTSMIDLEEVH